MTIAEHVTLLPHYGGGVQVPEVVRNKAVVAGAQWWLDDLEGLVGDLAWEWGLTIGDAFTGGTEAHVVEATLADGTPAVLKLLVPRDDDAASNEATVLRLADGGGCAQLYRCDVARSALLIERLGRPMFEVGLSLARRQELLCDAASGLWRSAPNCGLPTGAEKGRWLIDAITSLWDSLDRPCSIAAVDQAVACAEGRIACHDDERAVLVHGDIHQWNALESSDGGFKLIDPDGLLADAEYDLAILMREDPAELLVEDPRDRAHSLAMRTGRDALATWEWGIIERVSTGLLCKQIGLEPWGHLMLQVSDRIATDYPNFDT